MAKHYIRTDENNIIIKAFSDKFEQPEQGDICVNENGGRHYNLIIINELGDYLYKYENEQIVDNDLALSKAKNRKILQIKGNTEALSSKGFDYNGTVFGSEQSDRTHWAFMLGIKDDVSYPLVNIVRDIDGNFYTINERSDLIAIVMTGLAFVNTYRNSEKTIIDQVNACSTLGELEEVEDNRV